MIIFKAHPGLRSRGWSRRFWLKSESEFKTAMESESEKMPDSEKNINAFVHFTWAKVVLNISLQDLQSWVA